MTDILMLFLPLYLSGNDDWTKDIFKRIGGNRYDYIDEEREGNLSNTKRRYSDMPSISVITKSIQTIHIIIK